MRTLLVALFAACGALALSAAPAHAQTVTATLPITTGAISETGAITTVVDQGNNVYLVDGRSADLPSVLPPADVEKIVALQSAQIATGYKLLTPVSPDDQSVLVGAGDKSTFFVNLADGAITPVQVERLTASTNLVWLDDNTVGFLAIDPTNKEGKVVGASIDRRTGEIDYGEARLAAAAALNGQKQVVALISSGLRKVLVLDNTDGKPNPIFQMQDTWFDGATAFAPFNGQLASGYDTLPPNDKFLFSEGTRLQIVDVDTGERHEVIQLGPNTQVLDVAFSPDGNKFSVTTTYNEWNRTLRTTGGPRLSDVTYQDVTGQLPPTENPYFLENKVTVLDFPSGEVRTLRAADGDGSVFATASWSTDNQKLVVKVDQPGQAQGRRYPQYYPEFHAGASLRVYDEQLREVDRLERPEIDSPEMRARFVSPDEILIETRYGTNGHPYYYNVSTGEYRTLADRAGVYHFVTPTQRSREFITVFSSYTDPPELFRVGWDSTEMTQLTTWNAEVRKLSQARQYPVSFTLSNGETYEGVLLLPADVPFPPQNVPIVVWQAGGPTAVMSNTWQKSVESPQALLPNFGFGVLVVPLYGRYGVGPERFSRLVDNDNFGQADIDAQAEIAEQLRTRGWASKVGITGCSYGGYFVVQSLVRHPDTYDAGHAMCTIVDMIVEWNTGDGILAPWVIGRTPWEASDEYRHDSPIYQAQNVRTPLLAFHGSQDFLPVNLMLNFMLQANDQGVPTKLLIFQGANHNFSSTPAKLGVPYGLYGAQEQILWFRQYLGQ